MGGLIYSTGIMGILFDRWVKTYAHQSGDFSKLGSKLLKLHCLVVFQYFSGTSWWPDVTKFNLKKIMNTLGSLVQTS